MKNIPIFIFFFFLSVLLFSCKQPETNKSAVYFTDGGEVSLDLSDTDSELNLKWLNIQASRWLDETPVNGGDFLPLKTPGSGQWVALLKPN